MGSPPLSPLLARLLARVFWLLCIDIGTFDQEVEGLGPDDIPGQRYDLAAALEILRHRLRLSAVRLGQDGDLGADLLRRDLQGCVARDALQDEIALDRTDRVLAGILPQTRLVPSLELQHLLEPHAHALGPVPSVVDPVVGLLVDQALREDRRRPCRSSPPARGRAGRRRPRAPSPRSAAHGGRRAAAGSCRTPTPSWRNRRRPRGACGPSRPSRARVISTAAPPSSSPNRSGRASETFRIAPGLAPTSSTSSFSPTSPDPTKYR